MPQLEASIIRIFKADGRVIGAGFLVGETKVLTCAHVVATALGISGTNAEIPKTHVYLDFPLVAPGHKLTAQVISWQPIRDDGGGDIALLSLDSATLSGAKAIHLVVAEDLWGHSFRVFGFPYKHDQGVWASGNLRAREATGWIQIEDIKESGKQVLLGFSGGAVWDDQLNGVVGMVVAADEDPSKVAYIIPSSVLIQALPTLSQQAIPPCPYRGLLAFREQDAPYFFGREAFIQQLVDAVRRKPLFAIVGPSGSGKSSVVFAGLVPRLRQEGNWLITSFRPGDRPFHSLAAALMPLLEPQRSETDRLIEINKLAQHLQQGELPLQDVIKTIKQKLVGAHLLLIADQFEELYTLCRETEIRQNFLGELLTAIRATSTQDESKCTLVLTLRADFVGQAISYRPLADALQYADLKLGPMTQQELQDAIRKPAEKLHIRIEEGLSERILKDVNPESSHLPLLEFALTLLWTKQHDRKLTHAAYEETGGVEKALADHAEEVFATLNEYEQVQAQRIFVQLVRPGEGTEDTRRTATRVEVGKDNWELVLRLSNARLVVTEHDPITKEEIVEIIHEALIQSWQRLREWIEESRELRIWQERLRVALRQWESSGNDVGALLRGALIVEATKWLLQYPESISLPEKIFIETSQQHQDEEEQHLRKLLEEAEYQRQEAEKQRESAELHRQIALVRQLAAQSELLRNQHPHLLERSVLLAVEALGRFPCLEADQALRQGIELFRRSTVHLNYESRVNVLAFSPNGKYLATGCNDGTIQVLEAETGNLLVSMTHGGPVHTVVFSPNSRYLATASSNHTVCVWKAVNGSQIARIRYRFEANAIAFSPDGSSLAIASNDQVAELFETKSGQQQLRLEHGERVYDVAFSPDGYYLATTSRNNRADLWEASTGNHISTLKHQGSVYTVTFSPDGRYLATTSYDETARIWEVASVQQQACLPHTGLHGSAIFSANGLYLATASNDGTTKVWETPQGRLITTLNHVAAVNAIAFNPDSHSLATASSDRTVMVWEIPRIHLQAILRHENKVNALAFTPDGQYIATASGNKNVQTETEVASVRVWETSSAQDVIVLEHNAGVDVIRFSPDGLYIVTISRNRHNGISDTAEVWETATGVRQIYLEQKKNASSIAFSPDGHLLATGNKFRGAEIWEAEDGTLVANLHHRAGVNAVAFSPNGKYLATASSDNTTKLWDVASAQELTVLEHENEVRFAVFSPDGHYIVTVTGDETSFTAVEDKEATIWEVPSGHPVVKLVHNKKIKALAFSPDGHLLATASADNTARIWEVPSGRTLLELPHKKEINAITFSPNGYYIATASNDKTAAIWKTSNGIQITYVKHEGTINDISFCPDGFFLATASEDRTVGIWEWASGRQLARLINEGSVRAVLFSPDGKYLATASEDKTARLWLWKPDDLINKACSRITRNLTSSEWKQYLGNEPYHKTCSDLP